MRSVYGMKRCQVWRSLIFSAPRWWKPMSGRQWTISSSRRPTMTRNGPWVAPCCGPMLRYMSVGSSSALGRPHFSGVKRRSSIHSSYCSSGTSKGPYSVPREGCSLRSGWPFHQGGMRMRRRSGWPSTWMPNMSHTSRSYQPAAGQSDVMESMDGDSPVSATLRRRSAFRS